MHSNYDGEHNGQITSTFNPLTRRGEIYMTSSLHRRKTDSLVQTPEATLWPLFLYIHDIPQWMQKESWKQWGHRLINPTFSWPMSLEDQANYVLTAGTGSACRLPSHGFEITSGNSSGYISNQTAQVIQYLFADDLDLNKIGSLQIATGSLSCPLGVKQSAKWWQEVMERHDNVGSVKFMVQITQDWGMN